MFDALTSLLNRLIWISFWNIGLTHTRLSLRYRWLRGYAERNEGEGGGRKRGREIQSDRFRAVPSIPINLLHRNSSHSNSSSALTSHNWHFFFKSFFLKDKVTFHSLCSTVITSGVCQMHQSENVIRNDIPREHMDTTSLDSGKFVGRNSLHHYLLMKSNHFLQMQLELSIKIAIRSYALQN